MCVSWFDGATAANHYRSTWRVVALVRNVGGHSEPAWTAPLADRRINAIPPELAYYGPQRGRGRIEATARNVPQGWDEPFPGRVRALDDRTRTISQETSMTPPWTALTSTLCMLGVAAAGWNAPLRADVRAFDQAAPAAAAAPSPDALDKLLAPVALYPDQLLAQMLLCAADAARRFRS